MPDYEKMYFKLAARLADVTELLIEIQRECEEIYIENEDKPILQIVTEDGE
ncbi:MAG: hypothetical protein LBN99_01920 [Oscillospiraceae bacterium]|jgi:hypothetical protein|nr:hypothetical protein [Oscillospiraceae bacterium]